MVEALEKVIKEEDLQNFSDSEKTLLNAFYTLQRNPPRNDQEKIDLLRSKMGNGLIPNYFGSLALEREAYEYFFLLKLTREM